jgi:hypothetical protein
MLMRTAARSAILAGFLLAGVLPAASQDLTYEDRLVDGFEGKDFSAEGGLYYKKNYEQSAGKVEFQDKVVKTGKGAVRLSVKPLCSASDTLCSERAEVWELKKLRVPYERAHGSASRSNSKSRSPRTTTAI